MMKPSDESKLLYYFDMLAKLIANLNNIALTDDSSEEAKLQRVLKALADILSCEYAIVGEYDMNNREITITHQSPNCPIQGSFSFKKGSIWESIIQDQEFYGSDDVGTAAKELGIKTAIVVPFILSDGAQRVMACCNKKMKMPYSYDTYGSDEGKILQTVSILTAKQLDRERSVKYELEKAARVQKRLLPEKPPSIESVDLDCRYAAAKVVCGDYYDFVPLSGHELTIIIGDICGKGLEASLVMVMIRSFIHFILEKVDRQCSIDEIMFLLNNLIHRNIEEGMFATLVYATLDSQAKSIRYCSAGHLPPLVYRAKSCKFEQTDELSTGSILGQEDNSMYSIHHISLGTGDIVVFCTDGVYEARQPNSTQQFGIERLEEAIIETARNDASTIVKKVFSKMSVFCNGSQFQDDASLIVLKMK